MIDDVFCKIIAGRLPAKVIAEGKDWLAIEDVHPQAPIHVLVLPKKHAADITGAGDEILGVLLAAARETAVKLGIDKDGYRIIINQGKNGGQLVPHLHVHLLGGTALGAKIVR